MNWLLGNERPELRRSGAYNYEDRADINDGLGDDNRIDLDNGEGKISQQAASDANTPYVNLLGLTTSRDGEERRDAKPINIRNLRNEIIPFFVDTSTKVLKLKQMYANKVGDRMEPTGMMFISKGRRLDDDKTLHHYGIKPGDEIHLVLRLRGGILGGGKKKKRKTRRRRKKKRRKSRRKKTRKKRGNGPAMSRYYAHVEKRGEAMENVSHANKKFKEKINAYRNQTGELPSKKQKKEWVKELRKNVFHPDGNYYKQGLLKRWIPVPFKPVKDPYQAKMGGKRRRKRKSKKKKRR